MKIETTIKYYESYIPPRCRKPRYNEITEVVTHNLLETTTENVELAFSIDYVDKYNIYLHKNKVYKPVFFNANLWDNHKDITNALESLVYIHLNCSTYFAKTINWTPNFNYEDKSQYETKKQIIKRIKKDLGKLLIIDGILYERCDLPYYYVTTFGWGNNNGGTGLMIDFTKNYKKVKKILGDKCFTPYTYEQANKKAIEVATNRGDTEDVARGFNQSIICHISRLKDKY